MFYGGRSINIDLLSSQNMIFHSSMNKSG